MNFPTWSDLNSESIVPPLGDRKAPDIGPVALMVSCAPDLGLIRAGLDTPRTVGFFNNSLLLPPSGEKGLSVAGPFMGAPYAVMLLESLIARGADTVIVLGWCGGLIPDLSVGDLLLVDKAIVDEGTSVNYARLDPALPCSLPDPGLTRELAAFFNDFNGSDTRERTRRIQPVGKTIWTTDAIYRETPAKVAHFRGLGASAVEMECSALFSAAGYRRVKICALLVVSDSVAETGWQPGFRKKRFKAARQQACERVLAFCRKLMAERC